MNRVSIPATVNDVRLSSSTTIRRYRELEADGENKKSEIANFIVERFQERYLDPARTARTKSGFALMAINCLMIESLVSFRRGWRNTRNLSEAAFCFFFDRENTFSEFRGHAHEFYVNVRCGILHQAETTGGWLIHLKEEDFLFDPEHNIVNAKEFTERMADCLTAYRNELKIATWNNEIWVNLRKKMNAIIQNCE
jgi:hypothetical protein